MANAAPPTVSRDGVVYDPLADAWSLPTPGGPVRFDFLALAGISASLRESAKLAMRTSLTALPARTAHGDFSSLRALFRHARTLHPGCVFEEVTPELLCEYEASLPAGSRHRAGRLVFALSRWSASGVGGLSHDLASWLEWTPAETHVAGGAVRTCCPMRGALRPVDRDALLGALHEAYGSGAISLDDYATSLLVVVLALRPMQVACLKVGDLRPPSDSSTFAADLLVTRLKQRGLFPRDAFTPRGLVFSLAEVLRLQCADVTRLAAAGTPAAELPMFPAGQRATLFAPGFEGHRSPSAVSRRVVATLDPFIAAIDSAEPGHGFPLRMRRTLATTLHGEGCGVPEISVLLDHTGRRGALAYIEEPADLGARLGPAMGARLADLGARFRRSDPIGADR